MKTEELTSIGLTEEQATKVLAMNGKDIEKLKRTNADLTAERDGFKNRLGEAEKTLEGFNGLKPEEVESQINTYKQRAEKAEREYGDKLTRRDQQDWLTARYDEYGVNSPYARKQLTSEIMSKDDGLPWKDGAFLGFDDYMKAAKEKDKGLYLSEEEKESKKKQEKQEEKKKRFTSATGGKTEPDDDSENSGGFRFF